MFELFQCVFHYWLDYFNVRINTCVPGFLGSRSIAAFGFNSFLWPIMRFVLFFFEACLLLAMTKHSVICKTLERQICFNLQTARVLVSHTHIR